MNILFEIIKNVDPFFRPKFLTENGNLVIESALDKNISFRLKGSSCLNINDVNVMKLSTGTNQSMSSNSNLALRLLRLEEQFRQSAQSQTFEYDRRMTNRNIRQRLAELERKIGRDGSNITWTQMTRRIRQLENKVNQLMIRLNFDNCSSNPCQNGGSCTNTFGGYICRCSDAWTGNNCEEDVNECAIFAGTDLGCQNSLSCENSPGGYTLVNFFFTPFYE